MRALALKNLVFTIAVPGTTAVLIPLRLVGGRMPARGPLAVLAALVMAVGVAVYIWCVWDFATKGAGTPAPIDAPRSLVVTGPYRVVRNPMYLGVLLVLVGWTLLFRSSGLAWYAFGVAMVFHGFVTLYEEPTLRRRFGDEYDRYCQRVGRWLPW